MISSKNSILDPVNPGVLTPAPLMSASVGDPAFADSTISLSHYFWILRRRCWSILGFVAFCVLATFLVSSRLTRIYEATATIDIDRQSPTSIIGQEATRTMFNDSEQFLATQMKLIQSDSVLRPVARKYSLLKREGSEVNGNGQSQVDSARENAPVSLKMLKVTRPPTTYLLLVSYRSPDPGLAADVANAIADSYITHSYNLRFKASSSLSKFMEKQLEELKAKMERSIDALAQFERELNVINPEEKTSILSARLLQLNTEYTNAQSDRVRKEAAARSIETGSMDAALASPQGESLRKLIEHLNDQQEKFTAAQTQYGANHPEYKKLASQVAELNRMVESTRQSIGKRVEAEHREAKNREEMLRKTVAETKDEFDKLNARSFEYQQLKRDAEADKKLYDELVRRIKEAGINASFQNSSIRLADAARPPLRPVFPRTSMNLMLAFLLSALVAVGTAIVVDLMDSTVRDPDDVARTIDVAVLGTLPSVKNWRKRTATVLQGAEAGSEILPLNSDDKDQALSAFSESVRTLRNAILLTDFDRRVRSMLVTSSSPAEGKSTAASYLATAHAEQRKKTLLIDSDLRRPSVHRKFGLHPRAGLSNVLLGEVDWRQVLMKIESVPDLDILPAGPPSRRAADLFGSGLEELLEQAAQEYDLIIVDAPPLLGFAEPLRLASCVDGVLVVARAGETSRKAVGSVVTTLKRLRVNVLGLVLNEFKRGHSNGYYHYSYYGKYYKADQKA